MSLVQLVALAAGACAAPAESPAMVASEIGERPRPPKLPRDWGGPERAGRIRRPEAVIANAASAALDEAWSDPATRDAIVAVPVDMLSSDLFPYGDGQSNAAPSFNGWPAAAARPPVVATLIRTSSSAFVRVRFDRTLPAGDATRAMVRFRGASAPVDVPLAVEPSGDRVGRFDVSDASALTPFAIAPEGWRGGFAISFVHPVKEVATMSVADLLDRERVGARFAAEAGSSTVDARLRAHVFSVQYNQQGPGPVVPYTNADVHATFPSGGRLVRTGVGGGRTWVGGDRPRGYKTMYQCFDARNEAAEASPSDDGVPSATGWHRIGDRAETLANDLERVPMLVGFGRYDVLDADEVGPDGFAWGLDAVVTLRWLSPGEALVTPRGTFHWFAFSHDAPTCGEIVVSPESATLEGLDP